MAPVPVSVFRYFNGTSDVNADPWPIYREMMLRTGGLPNELMRKIRAFKTDTTDVQIIMDGVEASKQLEAEVRVLFNMVPFDPVTCKGAQWPHCLAVWEKFAAFMSDLKKKTETTPTSTPPSASQPDSIQATPTGSV